MAQYSYLSVNTRLLALSAPLRGLLRRFRSTRRLRRRCAVKGARHATLAAIESVRDAGKRHRF